ncbi:MAG: heavy-metal-associated domain-containing protein [Micrococcus sp.]|nr:heavy-metal-associated domain-containing protein [Micrococcus sp.]
MAALELKMTGLTCGHCIASVQEEVGEVTGVTAVDVDLVKDGVSTATILSVGELDLDAVRAAVEEAGYTVVQD